MPIAAPETKWQKFTKTTAPIDLLGAVVGAGGFGINAAKFFLSGEKWWGWTAVAFAGSSVAVQCWRARRTYQEQARRDSIHELQGCLQTLETILLGPDIDPAKRAGTGLRLAIHIPHEPGMLMQAMDYVGDQRRPNAAGRKSPENAGVIGQAYRYAHLHPEDPKVFWGSRTTTDYNAFVAQMVTDYAFTVEAAKRLSPATMSWAGFALINNVNGRVYGVLYCDSKRADFFSQARRDDMVHAAVGIAFFVGLRYP